MTTTRVPFVPDTFSILRPAMGKLAHEPGKTAATRANVRFFRFKVRGWDFSLFCRSQSFC